MRALPQIKAGVDLDGSLDGSPLSTRLGRPFMLVTHAGHDNWNDETWRSGWRELTGFRREIQLRKSGHLSFTDLDLLIAELGLRSRYSPEAQRALLGTLPPLDAIIATRGLLGSFFDHFLRGMDGGNAWLNQPGVVNHNLHCIR